MKVRLSIIILLLMAVQLSQAQVGSGGSFADMRAGQVSVVEEVHNPNKSLLLSLLPGGGQVYNGQAWKIPIFYAALGTVGYFAYTNYSDMKMFRDEYLAIGRDGVSTLPEYEGLSGYYIYTYYQSSNKNFQLFTILTIAVYGLNLLDAYVFGHLYDFNVSENLTLRVAPSAAPDFGSRWGVSPAINLSFTF